MPIVTAQRTRFQSSAPILDYYRCAELPAFGLSGVLSSSSGFFRFGQDVVCYGQAACETRPIVDNQLFDASRDVSVKGRTVLLPFDCTQVANSLRYEAYVVSGQRWIEKSWIKELYYTLRPLLPVSVRKHLQKLYLNDWQQIPFPGWPVDRSVDLLFERLLVLAIQALGVDQIPFIWFWPDGHTACAVMTHDVETAAGRDFCDRLMDIDDEFGIKASFQIVPEKRYAVANSYLEAIRSRGCEINVQGLDHDGNLFQNRSTFLESAKRINEYAKRYDARGFRSPILYRNVNWFQDLNFSYDMSVPNVARLEAQRGGCCTVMPYFLPGGIVELPVTMTEDYTLFHVLRDFSATLWKQQMHTIFQGHGLINFIVHPDYVINTRAQDVYRVVLDELGKLRSEGNIWTTLPNEVNRWWRERANLKLVLTGQTWTIEGEGSQRAHLAYARVIDGRLIYDIPASIAPLSGNTHPKNCTY